VIGDPLRAPDPERPEYWFIDDGRIYQVGIYPAVMPIFMTQGLSVSVLVELVSTVLYLLIGRFVDPRWKVVVSSKPMRRATMFHAVQVEFLESSEAADNRQADIVRLWRRGQFTHATPMTSLELSRARRETRRGRPALPAHTLAGFSLTRMRARFCLATGTVCVAMGLPLLGLHLSSRSLAMSYMTIGFGLVSLVFGLVLLMVELVTHARLDR
jgi:hypothetical protein